MHFHPLRSLILIALIAPLTLTGCDSDDPGDAGPGEEELITRVTLTLDSDASAIVVEVTDDTGLSEDGQTFDIPLVLEPNTTYQAAIRLFDDSDPDDVEDITEEVEAEAEAHKFRYTVEDEVAVTVSDLNVDADGLPLGTAFRVETGDAGEGTLRVQLFHYGDGAVKTATNASDETDVDFRIPLIVE